jgi:hypothetical protein
MSFRLFHVLSPCTFVPAEPLTTTAVIPPVEVALAVIKAVSSYIPGTSLASQIDLAPAVETVGVTSVARFPIALITAAYLVF